MSLGFSTRFACAAADRLFVPIEYLEEAVFVIFFTLAGASFRFGVFLHHLDLLALYFFARIGGKISGAWVGAGVLGAPAPVRRWLGLGLVPQAGVAIGLALSLAEEPVFRQAAAVLVTVFVGATLLCEIIGPFATRFAVERAGELGPHRERAKP